jgi:hypothetical protein
MSNVATQFKKGHTTNLGRKMSEVTKKRISAIHKKSGHKPTINTWGKGKKHTQKSIEKMRLSQKGKHAGEKAGMWKGGITKDINKYNRDRYKNLSEEKRAYASWTKNKRNRIKRANGGSHTFSDWELLKKQYNHTCPCCRKSEPEIKLTEDHIIPVSKGGSDNIENIQPLCKKCNFKKHIKIIKY